MIEIQGAGSPCKCCMQPSVMQGLHERSRAVSCFAPASIAVSLAVKPVALMLRDKSC